MKNQSDRNSVLLALIGLYGFIAALAYDGVYKAYPSCPMIVAPIFLFISLALTLPFTSLSLLKAEFKGLNIIRPLVFSLGQILVIGALSTGTVFAAFVSTAVGTTFTMIVGKLIFREKISFLSLLGILLMGAGLLLLNKNFSLPLLAVFAGVVQGVGVFLAKKRTITGAKPQEMAAASLLVLFCLCIPVTLLFLIFGSVNHSEINWIYISIAGIGFAILQSAYCHIAKLTESWMLSLVGNTRIPASILISSLLMLEAFSWKNFLCSLVVFIGVLIAYYGGRQVAERC